MGSQYLTPQRPKFVISLPPFGVILMDGDVDG